MGEECPSTDKDTLFDDAVLKRLDLSSCRFSERGLEYPNVDRGDLVARPLERGDFAKGFLSLLSQLTRVGSYGRETYEAQFDAIRASPGVTYIVVVEDRSKGRVVATGTLLMELKFIHDAAKRGRIEDLVVDEAYREHRLGSFLLELLTSLGKELGAYKITLDCKEDVMGFYKKYGYDNEGQLYLTQRFRD